MPRYSRYRRRYSNVELISDLLSTYLDQRTQEREFYAKQEREPKLVQVTGPEGGVSLQKAREDLLIRPPTPSRKENLLSTLSYYKGLFPEKTEFGQLQSLIEQDPDVTKSDEKLINNYLTNLIKEPEKPKLITVEREGKKVRAEDVIGLPVGEVEPDKFPRKVRHGRINRLLAMREGNKSYTDDMGDTKTVKTAWETKIYGKTLVNLLKKAAIEDNVLDYYSAEQMSNLMKEAGYSDSEIQKTILEMGYETESTDVSIEERFNQIISEGKTKEEAHSILQQEGF